MNKENMEVLADFTYNFLERRINNYNGNINSVCVDGGECVGTTTISKSVTEELNKLGIISEWTREPSLECKKEFINKMTYDNTLMSPGEKAESIIDIFMKDRKNNQEKMDSDKLYICDRSILSTIIYQSGILNDNTTIEEIKRNCELIEKINNNYQIKMPKVIFVLCATQPQVYDTDKPFNDKMEFERRLKLRQESGDIDGMDSLEKYLRVNDIYSNLMRKASSFSKGGPIEYLFPMEFKYDIQRITHSISHYIYAKFK